MNFTPDEWSRPFAAGGRPWTGEFYIDMAKAMERACFDYIMLEDTLMGSEAYRGTAEAALKYVLQVPKHDPLPLATGPPYVRASRQLAARTRLCGEARRLDHCDGQSRRGHEAISR